MPHYITRYYVKNRLPIFFRATAKYYVYFHDSLLGGPCYLKISSYLPFQCEFYFNGHNAIQVQLDKKGVRYRRQDNAFVDVEDTEAIRKAVESLNGRAVFNRVDYWMNLFFCGIEMIFTGFWLACFLPHCRSSVFC